MAEAGRRESVSEEDQKAYLEAIGDAANNPFGAMEFGDAVQADGEDLVDLSEEGVKRDGLGGLGDGLDLTLVNTPGTGTSGGKVSLGGAYYQDIDSKKFAVPAASPYTPDRVSKPGLRSWSVGLNGNGAGTEALLEDSGQRQLGLDILRARGPRTPSGTPILRTTTGGASLVGVRYENSGLTEVLASRRGLLEPQTESPGMRQRLLRATNRGQDASNKASFYAQELLKSEAAKRKWRDEALRHRHNFAFGDPRVRTPIQVKRRQIVKTPELVPQSRKGRQQLQPLSVSEWMTPLRVMAVCLALYVLRAFYFAESSQTTAGSPA